MKNMTMTLIFICTTAIAVYGKSKPSPMRTWNATQVIDAYVKTVNEGDSQWVDYLLANDIEYHFSESREKYSRKDIVKFLKSITSLSYNCITTYSILDENNATCMAKMTMQFETFIRTDYIYLTATDDGWKVRKVLVGHQLNHGTLS